MKIIPYKKIAKLLIANTKVRLAYLGIISTKKEDVHGRTYEYVYKKFGHKEMVDEYLRHNSWRIPKYIGKHY